jgi:hypothetical protein
VAALDTNPDLLLAAFLRMVRRLFTSPAEQIVWLAALQQQALIGSDTGVAAVLTNLQDYTSSSVSADNSSTQWLRELTAISIAQICEAALQRIEADIEAGGVGKAPSGDVRGVDFGSGPCVMG